MGSEMCIRDRDMYDIEHGRSPAAIPAVGGEFWDLKDAGVTPGHCDISPEFPVTFFMTPGQGVADLPGSV